MIKGALSFKILMGISLYLYEFLVFSDLSILLISNVVEYLQLILKNVLLILLITDVCDSWEIIIEIVDNFLWIIRYSVINFWRFNIIMTIIS
jgi:hypothetical protein